MASHTGSEAPPGVPIQDYTRPWLPPPGEQPQDSPLTAFPHTGVADLSQQQQHLMFSSYPLGLVQGQSSGQYQSQPVLFPGQLVPPPPLLSPTGQPLVSLQGSTPALGVAGQPPSSLSLFSSNHESNPELGNMTNVIAAQQLSNPLSPLDASCFSPMFPLQNLVSQQFPVGTNLQSIDQTQTGGQGQYTLAQHQTLQLQTQLQPNLLSQGSALGYPGPSSYAGGHLQNHDEYGSVAQNNRAPQQPLTQQQQQQQHRQQVQQDLQQHQQQPQLPNVGSQVRPTETVMQRITRQMTDSNGKVKSDTSAGLSYDEPDYSPQRPAPPSTYLPDPIHPHRNTLPYSLPTSLNPSLMLKTDVPNTVVTVQGITRQDVQNLQQPLSPEASWEGAKTDSLDEQTTSGRGSSISSSMSPPGSSPTSPRLGRGDSQWANHTVACYEKPSQADVCLRCLRKVYAMESLGPVKGALYHKLCFTCVTCGTKYALSCFITILMYPSFPLSFLLTSDWNYNTLEQALSQRHSLLSIIPSLRSVSTTGVK
ncbi:putative mediator of RNA polymerase II transcription subunit 12 [Aplysia californica]|uniref:Mediator of RNA polymerase II transcription subunit 12 n=1 Tax=Aplysia californica TaxID=6500 RepID=A0ABM1VU91_APLCA|nr:putative mediator of RNA polymerase II transcription subunit 12 [Aplysia californica]